LIFHCKGNLFLYPPKRNDTNNNKEDIPQKSNFKDLKDNQFKKYQYKIKEDKEKIKRQNIN